MEFGTWYQYNLGTEKEWQDDFGTMRDSGFDFVVLWHVGRYPAGKEVGADYRIPVKGNLTDQVFKTAEKAGLKAYLGVFHPYNMGYIPPKYRLKWSHGKTINGPNIFNEEWIRKEWGPYLEAVTRRYSGCRAFGGLYFDDTYPSVPTQGIGYHNYTPADKKRFQKWLKDRYLSIENLNMLYKLHKTGKKYRSFESVNLPRHPEEGLALWNDWTIARAQWCTGFARISKETVRAIDTNRRHQLVLSDQDYHMRCNGLQYGVDYKQLLEHYDRFEIYMAHHMAQLDKRTILKNVLHNIRKGKEIAGEKPFQIHYWTANSGDYSTLKPSLLSAMIEYAAENQVRTVELYTYKIIDWRVPHQQRYRDKPELKELSLKYHPELLKVVKKLKKKLS
jgi:hypothetical protein